MFCSHCGTKVEEGQRFCSSCGKSLVAGVSSEGRVGEHLQLVGILWIVFSTFRLIGAVATLGIGGLLFSHLPIEVGIRGDFLSTVISVVGGGLLLTGAAGLAAGLGLLGRRSWARILGLIMAFLSLLEMPFGTMLGIYTLWVLLPAEGEDEYRRITSGG